VFVAVVRPEALPSVDFSVRPGFVVRFRRPVSPVQFHVLDVISANWQHF
jgi:hypothetical protein